MNQDHKKVLINVLLIYSFCECKLFIHQMNERFWIAGRIGLWMKTWPYKTGGHLQWGLVKQWTAVSDLVVFIYLAESIHFLNKERRSAWLILMPFLQLHMK